MKFNAFSALAIASALLIGTAAEMTLNSSIVRAESSQQIAQNQSVLASGRFVTVEQDHPTNGTARIVRENGTNYLEFDGAFTTAQGPDVTVLLHRKNTVGVKLNEADYITLASLKSFNGAQRYELPESVNINDYQSVVIWCRKFNVSFGYAAF